MLRREPGGHAVDHDRHQQTPPKVPHDPARPPHRSAPRQAHPRQNRNLHFLALARARQGGRHDAVARDPGGA